MLKKKILNRMAALIEQGLAFKEEFRDEHGVGDEVREARARRTVRWQRSCVNVLDFANLKQFKEQFLAALKSRSYAAYKYSQLVGILESAQDEIEAGFIGSIRHLAHADLFDSLAEQAFDSLAEQAEELRKAGHLIPAAVLGRVVIERWLFDQAEEHGVEVGDRAKASTVNDLLKKEEVYSVPKWRQIQSFLDVGNSAAHGKPEEFGNDDVVRMLSFITTNCV